MQITATNALINSEAAPASANRKPEFWIFAALLVVLNIPLLSGSWNHSFTFLPSAVTAGEWWRVLAFPFVHVSAYHLLIDGIAFALLYSAWSEKSLLKRLFICFASVMGSLLISLWSSLEIQNVGLCGLSGIGHGLMAVCALEMLSAKDKTARTVALISFIFVIGKCALEAVTGRLIFDLVHFGGIGVPIVVCHAGGVLGAVTAMLLLKANRAEPDGRNSQPAR